MILSSQNSQSQPDGQITEYLKAQKKKSHENSDNNINNNNDEKSTDASNQQKPIVNMDTNNWLDDEDGDNAMLDIEF